MDDCFIQGAKKSSKLINIEKHDISKCINSFNKAFFNKTTNDNTSVLNNKIYITKDSSIILSAIEGNIEFNNNLLRSSLWSISLYNLNKTNTFFCLIDWIEIVEKNRDLYKRKLKELTTLKNYSSDPLGTENNGEWNSFFEDNQVKKLIIKDIDRTYQEKDLFKNNYVKEMLTTILFIWSKENRHIGYWQGMNEILALTLLALHPYYYSKYSSNQVFYSLLDKKNVIKRNNINNLNRSYTTIEDVYYYLHDLEELPADCYSLFDLLMKRVWEHLYDKNFLKEVFNINNQLCKNDNNNNDDKQFINKSNNLNTNSSETRDNYNRKFKDIICSFSESLSISSNNNNNNNNNNNSSRSNFKSLKNDFLKFRIDSMFNVILKEADAKLHKFLINNELDYFMVCQRWYRCIYNREFHSSDCLKIIDALLSVDYIDIINNKNSNIKNDNNNLIISYCSLLDYISAAMILYIKEDLMSRTNYDCLVRLNKYPPVESVQSIINLGISLRKKLLFKFNKKTNKIENDNTKKEIEDNSIKTNKDKSNINKSALETNNNINIKQTESNNIKNVENNPYKNNINKMITDLNYLNKEYLYCLKDNDKDKLSSIVSALKLLNNSK